MSSDWVDYSIEELASSEAGSLAVGPFGSRMKADLYVPEGVRIIRGQNLANSPKLVGDFVHVTEETASSLQSCRLKPGDLVFPHRGNIGEVGITPADDASYMLSTSLMKLAVNRKLVVPEFLYYFFRSSAGRAALLMNASQVGTPGIATPLRSLRAIRVRVPDVGEQVRILGLLSALDDRITLLRETNATLEAIAQALFKSWFVEFDPVRAKRDGRAPEGMDEATAALFPESFEDSELGEVPRGWHIGSIASLMRLHRGSVNPGNAPEKWFQHFSLPAYDDGQTPVVQLGAEIKSNKTSVPENAVLLSKLNPHIPRVWLPSSINAEAVCSTEFLVFFPTQVSTTNFVYSLLNAPDFCSRLCQLVTGTSNSHQRVKPDSVLGLPQVCAAPRIRSISI